MIVGSCAALVRTGKHSPRKTPCFPPFISLPSAVVNDTGNVARWSLSGGNSPIRMASGILAPESTNARADCRVLGPMRLMEHAVSICIINSRREVRQSVCGRRIAVFHSAHICVGSHLTSFAGLAAETVRRQSGAAQTFPSGRSSCGTSHLWGTSARGLVPDFRGRRVDGPAVPWRLYSSAGPSSALAESASSTFTLLSWKSDQHSWPSE